MCPQKVSMRNDYTEFAAERFTSLYVNRAS
jgi:hypothetical protein